MNLSATDLMFIGTIAATAIAVFLLVRALYPQEILEQMRREAEAQQAARDLDDPSSRKRRGTPLSAFGKALVARVGDLNAPLVRERFREKVTRKFVAMGRPDYRPQDFIAQQELWGVFFLLLGLMLMNMLHRPLLYCVPFGVFGALFPHIWLREQVTKRQRAISRALPYHIDLLTLSVEAGLDFQAALGTVVKKGQVGPLIEELSLVLSEIRLGKTRAESLRNFADRVQISEVSAFVANLVQADRMGTSMGKVLRIQSTQMRIMRTHRAEKLANEAPIKMLLPLIGCIFPTVFLVLFGPIVYRLMYGS